ncbi:MAG: hypothetical protein LQ338_003320 [Usnochroma carphineum]|nr:MAG: hypothetical protein LQ338_003320 [Usnochroma carphineum]
MEDIPETPPQDIDPYTTLDLISSATAAEIKTAYKKLALRHHPDKASSSEQSTAHTTFQRIAFAYAILSSPRRRQLYDTTGSTSETLGSIEDDDFDWLSFFRTQYSSVSASAVADFSCSYKSSPEERRDVLAAFTKHRGKWGKVYEEVMLSDPLEDEERFREMVDEAIKKGEVEGYDAHVNESKKSREARMKKARREKEEAEKEARTNKKYRSIFGGDGKGGSVAKAKAVEVDDANANGVDGKKRKARKADREENGDIGDLAAMIQSRNKERSDGFFDKLEAKYAGDSATGRGKKRKAVEEPDEEAFERTRVKMAKAKAERAPKAEVNGKTARGRKRKASVVDDEDVEDEEGDGDIDLEDETEGDDDESEHDLAEEEEEEEEEVEVKPKRKAQKSNPKKAVAPAAKKKTRGKGRGRE